MTDLPTVTALPAPPQRGQDNAVFIQRADAFIDALILFVAQLNAFAAQLVLATQERVVNEAAGSYAGAIAARDVAIAARDAAQAFANSIDPATLVKLTGNQSIAGTKNFTGILQLAGAAITAAATFPEATTADMLANVDKRLLSVRAAWNALVPVALADAATIALDLSTGIHFTVTLAGNRVLGAPSNLKPGQEGFIRVVQDATGGRALSFAAAYKFLDLATAPSLNTAAAAVTLLRYHVSAAAEVFIGGGKPAGGPAAFGYQSGQYYGPPISAQPSQIAFSGTFWVPLEIRSTVAISAIGIRATQNTNVVGSIYTAASNGRPGNLIAASGATSTIVNGTTDCLVGVTLAPGAYWIAMSFAASINCMGTSNAPFHASGYLQRPSTADGTYSDAIRADNTSPPATYSGGASNPTFTNYTPVITFKVA